MAAQNFGHHMSRLAGAVDAMVGELVRRKTLREKAAETGFIAEKRAAGHGHTTGEQDVCRRIEPKNGDTRAAEKLGAAGLGVGAATESDDGAFLEFGGATDHRAELVGFELAKGGLPVPLEKLRNGDAARLFDAVIQIDEAPGELTGKEHADGGFAGAHESGEGEDGKMIGGRGIRPVLCTVFWIHELHGSDWKGPVPRGNFGGGEVSTD